MIIGKYVQGDYPGFNLVWIKTNLYDWESTVRIINTYSDS